ncbi:sugar phosphate isomerase/epimerase family protein [Egibacter rhizosphaerae]|uniref:sugar phosphate isomerase/epimerase family protein n=1 Tax=Egibacter rhizosphaerae TaxID=1670831 RepID=UPI0013F15A7B|nr:sugar phosphate isomerase/epimerase [Egibacter rhizosphaerae]
MAGAPCNLGVGSPDAASSDPAAFLGRLAGDGFDGTDLGPPEYLASADGLVASLSHHGLGLAGGWVSLGEDSSERELEHVLDACDIGASARPDLPTPRPTFGAPRTRSGRVGTGEHETDAREWARLVTLVEDARRRCEDRGHPAVFHPHAGTLVETAVQTERLLAETSVELCFDTGHVRLGGDDPLATLQAWRDRVTHLHVKDVDAATADRLRQGRSPVDDVWDSGVFAELGTGDLPLGEVLGQLLDWQGWVVIEQDASPRTPEAVSRALEAHGRNRRFLAELGW